MGKNAGADEGTFRGRTKAVRSAGSHGNRGFPAGGSCKRREEHFFCRNLTCRRKKLLIFENLNLSLPAGKITALTGRNGAGKTTLAMVLAGLQKQSGGEIYIGGKKLPAGKRRKVVWYSSNDTGTQFFTTSVTEELLLHSDASSGRLEHARTLLKTLGLYAYKDTHPAALSGGQKQRLSIACGLLSGREILLFDEPTSGLDGGNMRKIAAVLTVAAAEGKTIGVITHDKELMQACCDFPMETGVMNTDNKMCNISLTSSMEDYLEAVLVLQQKHGYIRCVDVAGYLGVTKPSVSRAVKELSKKKCLLKKDDGTLSLTEQGRQIAQQIYEKHQFFTKQLIEAGVPRDIAVQDACRLEHVISETSFNKLKEAAWMKAQEVIPSEK